jgi:hypothetical protein
MVPNTGDERQANIRTFTKLFSVKKKKTIDMALTTKKMNKIKGKFFKRELTILKQECFRFNIQWLYKY